MDDTISLGATEEEDLDEWFDSYVSVFPSHHSKLYADFPLYLAGEGASSSCRVDSTCIPIAISLCLATEDNTCLHCSSFAKCARCKGKGKQSNQHTSNMWMLDSGASMHFTFSMNNFADFQPYETHRPLQTADGITYMTGAGTVFLVLETGKTVKLINIGFVPNLRSKLVSMGALLCDGMEARASTSSIAFYKQNKLVVMFEPHFIGDTIYVVFTQPSMA